MTTLTIFANEITRLAGTVQANIPKMQKEAALAIVTEVAYATPVDTGQASGNWLTTVGPSSAPYTEGPSNPDASINNVMPALSSLGMGQEVHITNDVPYIIELNNGRSEQAEAGFVEMAAEHALHILGRYDILGA